MAVSGKQEENDLKIESGSGSPYLHGAVIPLRLALQTDKLFGSLFFKFLSVMTTLDKMT